MGAFDSITSGLGGFGGGNMFKIITYAAIFIIVAALLGWITWMIVVRIKFNKKIVFFEEINGKFEPTREDRALQIKVGRAGDTLYYLRKAKTYVPVPTIQTGRNTFWFFIRSDGEMINFGPGNFNEQMREMNAMFLDKEMRYARTSLQTLMKERYEKPSFWKVYGGLIVNIAVIVVIMVFLWLIVDKLIDFAGTTGDILNRIDPVLDRADQILDSLNNICTGRSGLVPAS